MSRRFLFRLFSAAVSAGDHVSDGELLRRFVATRDSAAFELLVRRHADAVWVAGFRILAKEADAEDVFQATFLALVKKAGSIRDTCVGGWLHRVAVNAALKLKASREREQSSLRSLTLPARQHAEQDELASIVHQELARLPDRYRLPVVLCDLEGQSHAEAAKALGWPIGSVSGRLSRARDILRDRLSRRGLGVPIVLLTGSIAPTSAINVATDLAAGTVVASPVVSSLAEGVLSAMSIAKLKLTAAIVAATGLIALAGAGTVYALTRPGPPVVIPLAAEVPVNVAQADEAKLEDWTPNTDAKGRAPVVPSAFPELKAPDPVKDQEHRKSLAKMCPRILGEDPPAIVAADDTYRRLLKARLHQGRLYLQQILVVIAIGRWDPSYMSELFSSLNDMRATTLELWGNEPKSLIPWLEEFVVMGKYVEHFFLVRIDAGNEPPQHGCLAQQHRLEAEATLWKAKNAQRQGGAK